MPEENGNRALDRAGLKETGLTAMKRLLALHLLVVACFGIFAYANSFSNQFLYDDEHYVVKNRFIRNIAFLPEIFTTDAVAGSGQRSNFYRPLQLVAYLAVYGVFGLDVGGFHLLNLSLHLGNAFLVYFLARRLWGREPVSFFASLLFAVHPVQTEAVTYMNGTADPLAAFFGLASLLCHLKADGKTAFRAASLACFAAALLAKETIVVVPALVILLDVGRGRKLRETAKGCLPYLLLMAAYLWARATALNFTQSLNLFAGSNIYTENPSYRLYTFLAGLTEYYQVLLFPLRLKYDRALVVFINPLSSRVLLSLLLLVPLFVSALRSLRRDRVVFLGIAWFFVSLAPVSGAIPINGFAMEHWLYFPSIGFFITVAYLAAGFPRETVGPSSSGEWRGCGKCSLALVLVVAALFAVLTRERNKVWREPVCFYEAVLEHNPQIARVRNNLGMAYVSRGRPAEGLEQFKLAVALEDRYPETHYNLALLYFQLGLDREGTLQLYRALEVDGDFLPAARALEEISGRREGGEAAKFPPD